MSVRNDDLADDLLTTREELHTAEEELRAQNDQLLAAHEVILAERLRYQELFHRLPGSSIVIPQGSLTVAAGVVDVDAIRLSIGDLLMARAQNAPQDIHKAIIKTPDGLDLVPPDSMLIRHAVVPNVMVCHHGSSIGIAVRIPEQQHSASVSTNGAVRDRRIVFGNDRLRSSPEQNGHFHRVAPSPSGPACRVSRHQARWLNLAS